MLFAIPFIAYYIIRDLIAFLHLLLEYRLQDINQVNQSEIYLKDDKVIIYNELLSTMKAIRNEIFDKKEEGL